MILEFCMIIKDSGRSIIPVLESVKPYIDHWTILDTGSTDNTTEIVRKCMKGCPGNLYEESFVDFSTSRNRVLELAGIRCKYTLMLDDTYILTGGKKLKRFLKRANKNSYNIIIADDTREYFSCRILRMAARLRYRYKIHEVIDTENTRNLKLENVFIYDEYSPYMTARTETRYRNDIRLLLEDLVDHPDDPRIIFYIAETYCRIEDYKNAEKYYILRTNLTGDPVEIFLAYFGLGMLYNRCIKKPWKFSEEMYLSAFKAYPARSESLLEIAKHYHHLGIYKKTYECMKQAVQIPMPQDGHPVGYMTYREEVPYLLIDSAIRIGEIEYAKTITRKVISENPRNIQKFHNVLYALDHTANPNLKPSQTPLLVIHDGHIVKYWTPKSAELVGSGSEIMAMNLGKEFAELKYRVVLFGGFKQGNKDSQGTYDGVEYMDVSKYNEFLRDTYVDVLLVSRVSDNLVFYDNIGKVFLWLHDTLPIGEAFQTHAKKFKGVLCLSEWHKQFFCEEFKFPKGLVHVTGNAIDVKRFEAKTQKIPYKFIYSSSPDRGLDNLLEMFPRVHERYPKAELHIFGNEALLTRETLQTIADHDYIKLHGRVSQKKISREYLSSDVWLYPTEFKETYCITALEAQVSKVLCVCTDLAGLTGTGGSRGVLVKGKASTRKFQDEMLKKLFWVLDNSSVKKHLIEKAYNWAQQQTLENLALNWHTGFFT